MNRRAFLRLGFLAVLAAKFSLPESKPLRPRPDPRDGFLLGYRGADFQNPAAAGFVYSPYLPLYTTEVRAAPLFRYDAPPGPVGKYVG